MVVAAVMRTSVALREGSAAKLGREITSVSSSRPRCFRSRISPAIGWSTLLHTLRQATSDTRMVIPAHVNQHCVPHVALREAAREQAVAREGGRLGHVGAVQIQYVLRLAGGVRNLRHCRLCIRFAISYWLILRGDLPVARRRLLRAAQAP